MKYAFLALAAIAVGSLSACQSTSKKSCSSTVIQQDGKSVQAPAKSCCKKH